MQQISSKPPTVLDALDDYKRQIDTDIAAFCEISLAEVRKEFGASSEEAFGAYLDILQRGGKRLRGGLTICAYQMLGGKDEAMILQAARVVEMLHAYLLVVDDFADRSETRRGGLAAHVLLRKRHEAWSLRGDGAHFGDSVAVNAALLGCHMAMEIVSDLDAPASTKNKALKMLNHALAITGHGQIHDVFNEALTDVSEAEVIKTLVWKTAYYTFLNPLQFGAILAGAGDDDIQKLHEYSMHAGLAFQLADDILGTFGDEQNSGKSTIDDLREGKMTLLVVRTLARATDEQARELRQILGNADLMLADHKCAKQIMQDTGALQYTKDLAAKHAELAKNALDGAPREWRCKQLIFLRDLPEYVTKRVR